MMVSKTGNVSKKVLPVRKSIGQLFLILVIILNALVLLIDIKTNSLESKLIDLKDDEKYFMFNDRLRREIENENFNRQIDLKFMNLLGRLAHDFLLPKEIIALDQNQQVLEQEIRRSFRQLMGTWYLQGHDLPDGTDIDSMFAEVTNNQLAALLPEYQEKAAKVIRNIKTEMIDITDNIHMWKMVYRTSLIISTILLVIANLLIFTGRKPSGDQM